MSEVDTGAVAEQEDQASPGGWRSQSPVMKVLLFVSLVCVALGVYRCSVELTPVEGPRTIRVERATIAVPDSLLAISPDSTAALATRFFARALKGHEGAVVTTHDTGEVWAVVRLHVGETSDGVELVGTAASALSGRRMSAVTAKGSPDRLREMASEAAAEMWSDLDAESDLEAEAQ